MFGGGKVVRDGMGMSSKKVGPPHLDLVITNVVILDWWGVVKADIGIRDGKIVGIGKSGNPFVMNDVDPELVVGTGTEVISGEGMICTAGGIDTHIHFICPQRCDVAIAAGITSMTGGGTGPATGTWAGEHQPDPVVHREHVRRAPRHAARVPPPVEAHPGGRGVRREPPSG